MIPKISERTLRKWRREALEFIEDIKNMQEADLVLELCNRTLRMTQELLDQHLIKSR